MEEQHGQIHIIYKMKNANKSYIRGKLKNQEPGFAKSGSWLYYLGRRFCMRERERVAYVDATLALYKLSSFMYQYYGKRVLILLDEYDTPMQEAYVPEYDTHVVFGGGDRL